MEVESGNVDNQHRHLNPIQARGALCAPSPKSQHIFKTAWSLELLLRHFSFYVFSIKKSSVKPISPHVCCHGNHTTFWLIFENLNHHCFQVFPPEKNILRDNLCFGHHNTLRSLIIAYIRTVTMKTFQKIIFPKYGHQH